MKEVNKENVVKAAIKTCRYSELGNPDCQNKTPEECRKCPKMLLMCKIMGVDSSTKIGLKNILKNLSNFDFGLDEVAVFINSLIEDEKINFKG